MTTVGSEYLAFCLARSIGLGRRVVEAWTIFEDPPDMIPHRYVARRFVCNEPTPDTLFGNTLHEVRASIHAAAPSAVRFERDDSDVSCLVETWLATAATE